MSHDLDNIQEKFKHLCNCLQENLVDDHTQDQINTILDGIDHLFNKIQENNSNTNYIISLLTECINNKTSTIVEFLNDNETLELDYETADCVSRVFDDLNEENREKMKILLTNNKETYLNCVEFCKNYNKK